MSEPETRDIVTRLREGLYDQDIPTMLGPLLDEAAAEIEMLRKLDQGAAKVEEIICLRSPTFTGEPPYVGWEGLAKALTEDYNELQILKGV